MGLCYCTICGAVYVDMPEQSIYCRNEDCLPTETWCPPPMEKFQLSVAAFGASAPPPQQTTVYEQAHG